MVNRGDIRLDVDTNLLKLKLSQACRILYYERSTTQGRGHQCYVLEGEKMLIPGHLHPLGLSLGDMQPDDIITIDFDGKVLEGKHDEPMGEFYIYPAIFRRRKDVKSIIHIHPPNLGILVSSGQNILPVTRDSLLFRNGLPIFEKFPLYIGSKELAEQAADKLGDANALIHKGHGAVVVGKSIESTLLTALALERAARIQLGASQTGKLSMLPEEEMSKHHSTHTQ
ncbi:MAG: class II aldolase/adducin family protein, partial [Nitrososphaerales archaeon]